MQPGTLLSTQFEAVNETGRPTNRSGDLSRGDRSQSDGGAPVRSQSPSGNDMRHPRTERTLNSNVCSNVDDSTDHIAEPGAVMLPASVANPRGEVPVSLCRAKEIMRLALLDNNTCKAIIKSIKVVGGQNAKVATKLKVIAIKMTQRQFCLNSALDLVEKTESGENVVAHELQCLRPTSVRINKNVGDGREDIVWLRGDIPVFENDEVMIGKPDAIEGQSVPQPSQREPDFEASEYCRILHVLADSRMTSARTQLMEPKTREELDMEPTDPWTDQIAPLFNDLSFKPRVLETLAGGVTRADISALNPAIRPYERPAGVLKRKFGEFKSAYGICLSKYETSGQGDPDVFVLFANGKTYIMYAFCFLKKHPVLEPLATRALVSDAQREEGVGDGVTPRSKDLHGYRRKRKRDKQEINIVGLDSISSALRPMSENVARETEEAERDKAKFEAAEAKGKSAQSLLSAISQAKSMLSAATTDEEKALYDGIVKSLMENLSSSFA